jgi:hypothetical protein
VYLGPAYRLFICDEDDWCAQGHYENIISRTPTSEDYITWMKDESGKDFIHVLGVSFFSIDILIFFKENFRQHSIQVVLYIFQALLAAVLVWALVQLLVLIQVLVVLPLLSGVLPIPIHRHLSQVLLIPMYSMAGT